MTSLISIIIPTLNEERQLPVLLSLLQGRQDLEIIVADGGSTDRTLGIASEYKVKSVSSSGGRGPQQNAGARIATGDILMFLHSDTILPEHFRESVETLLNLHGTAAGVFPLKINAAGRTYRLIERAANLRSRLLGLSYGDQVLFMRRNIFIRAGGFPDQPLLEDLGLVSHLKRFGRIRIAPQPVLTSARRWERLGPWQTTLFNQCILAGYLLGMDPRTLARLYYRTRNKEKDRRGI